MRTWIVGLTVAISICLLDSTAIAQAAAEGALTHALSSGMGSSLGNAMGKATNQMAGRVAQPTSRVAPKPGGAAGVKHPGTTTAPVPATSAQSQNEAPVSVPPNNGSMIVSIQGGVRQQPQCVAPAEDATAATTAASANPSSSPTASTPSAECNKAKDPAVLAHPSEITLQMPK
jgi:hypothetical protein